MNFSHRSARIETKRDISFDFGSLVIIHKSIKHNYDVLMYIYNIFKTEIDARSETKDISQHKVTYFTYIFDKCLFYIKLCNNLFVYNVYYLYFTNKHTHTHTHTHFHVNDILQIL